MEEVLRFMELEGGRGTTISLWEGLFAVLVSFACSVVIGGTYRATHRTPGYSQSFVHTLAIIGMITSVIMVIIGSNIARAFSLVGAMSIIRFRNAVKETRDVGFLFFSIASGMGAGTRFYSLTLATTGLICGIIFLMDRLDYARPQGRPESLLRVQMPVGSDPETFLEPVFEQLFESFSLVTVETVRQGLAVESVYSVKAKPKVKSAEILEKLGGINENMKVLYHLGAHSDPV